jgi:hypothetical protein
VVKRIVDDVLDRRLILIVRLDHLRPVAAAEDVILPSVSLVEGAGVAAVQVPHPVVEVRQRCLDEQVVVVTHQAAHVSAPAVAPFDPAQDVEEDDPVPIVQHDRRVVVAADPDVVEGAGFEVAEGASHCPKVALRDPGNPRCDAFRLTPDSVLSRARHETGEDGASPRRTCLAGTG